MDLHSRLEGRNTNAMNAQLSKLYNYLLNVSIVTRWALFIIPVLGILWIPGILGFTKYPDTRVSTFGPMLRLSYLSIS